MERIRFLPYPGTATEEDLVRIEQQENRLCELVAGVLVEKPMGFRESLLAVAMNHAFYEDRDVAKKLPANHGSVLVDNIALCHLGNIMWWGHKTGGR